MNPDATGTYIESGSYKGKIYLKRTDNSYFVWWDGIAAWWISTVLAVKGASYWGRTDPNIEGAYSELGGATGEATVTEI